MVRCYAESFIQHRLNLTSNSLSLMNINEPNSEARERMLAADRQITESVASEEELRSLAEDIVKYCPSLTHLLLAMGSNKQENPLRGLN